MDVFNKIYSQVSSSVSSTVSQLSGVLPGNPVTREFDANAHVASAGPGLLWKIYKGSKRSTKQEASIFVFEKRQLEKWNKTDRDLILESLRRGVTQLTKIRHPQILIVQHPLEESRESLAFATEPVFASLANILGCTTNMPQPANISDYKFFDIEIKYGLQQLSEGLAFLHNDVKLLHKNICPESIVVNQQGAWKIFGLGFCVHNTSPPNSPPNYPFEAFSPTLPDQCQPNLDYLAPECIISETHSTASDMFSVGMLIYALNSRGQTLQPVKDLQQFKNRVQKLKGLNAGQLQSIPEGLREFTRLLLSVTPEIRPDAHQFVKIPYFDDIGVKTLNYLDSLLQCDNLQKSQFYKGLPSALPKLPHRVKLRRVMPCLNRDLAQPTMVPFVLPSIFEIAKECNKEEYCTYILPHLKSVMKLTDPIQILIIMLQRMELLLKLTPAEDIQQHVLPMLYRGLDSDSPQIHELCLAVLPTFAVLLDHSNVKNSLLPRIKKLCLSTSSLSVRVNCLLCIGRLLEHLDKWLVLDEILPFLPQIPSREPAVLMGILGIYKLALNHKKLGISKEVIATRILPFLMPLCIENGLTLAQFNALVALVKDMFQIVENEHRTKLEQLNSVKDQQKVLTASMPTFVASTGSSPAIELDKAFSGLGLDSFIPNSSISLQEKQKMVQQQDAIRTFSTQPELEPLKASPSPQLAKDLTASLSSFEIQSPQLVPKQTTNLNVQKMNTSFSSFSSSSMTPQNSTFPSKSNQNVLSSNVPIKESASQWNSSLSGNILPSENNGQNWGGFQNWQSSNVSNLSWGNQPQLTNTPWNNNTSSNKNWGALDTLLSSTTTTTNGNKIPMNQMMSSTAKNQLNSNNNALTKDDIMDLLS